MCVCEREREKERKNSAGEADVIHVSNCFNNRLRRKTERYKKIDILIEKQTNEALTIEFHWYKWWPTMPRLVT